MMIIVNRIDDAITGSANGKHFGVSYDEQKYAQMKDLEAKAAAAKTLPELQLILDEFEPMTKESYKELVEHAKGGQFLWVNPHTGKIFLAINGKVSSKPLPKAFVDRIITSVEKKIDVMPLVKAWARFLRNPWYTDAKAKLFAQYINTTVVNYDLKGQLMENSGLSDEVATARATMFDVSFTNEGLLATYKVVREIDWKYVADEDSPNGVKKKDRYDYDVDDITGLKTYKQPEFLEARVFEPAVVGQGHDAFFCGKKEGHVIRVGQAVYLDSWDKVNKDDNQSCVKGIHLGGLRYIKNYQNDDTITLNTFVDPMHIGAFDNSGNGALRVLKFFPHSALTAVTEKLYHSSEYAKLTDEEYKQMITEAVEATEAKVGELQAELDEKKNLLDGTSDGAKLMVDDSVTS